MKLLVSNKGHFKIERLGITFSPGVTQEVEVKSVEEYVAVSAPRLLDVQIIEEPKQKKTKNVDSGEQSNVKDGE